MLSFKPIILFTTAILVGNATAAVAGACLNDHEMYVLLTNDDVWDARPNAEGLFNPNVLPAWPHGGGGAGAVAVNFPAFRDKVTNAFQSDDCIKSMFVNAKTNWENAYPTARTNIIARLYRLNKLSLLRFDNLPGSTCKEVMNAAGTGYGPPFMAIGLAPIRVANDPELATATNYQLQSSQFSKFHIGCWSNQPASVQLWTRDRIKNIPAEAFNDYRATALVNQPVTGALPLFSEMNAKQVASFITNPERCTTFNLQDITLSNPHQSIVSLYKPACLAQMGWLQAAIAGDRDKVKDWVKRLNSKAFSTLDFTPHDDIVGFITSAQAAQLDSDNKTEFRCNQLTNLHQLTAPALANVDKACMAGYLSAIGNPAPFGQKIGKASGGVFSDIPTGDLTSISRVMTQANIKYLGTEHLKTLLAVPAACSFIFLPDGDKKTLEWSRLPIITAECWHHIPAETKTAILASDNAIKRLDEKILLHAEKSDVPSDVLITLAKRRVGLLKHVGALVPAGSEHPCSAFSLDEYKDKKEIRAILDNSNSACIRSITGLDALEDETADEKFFKGLPHIIFASMDLDILKAHKHLPKDFWSNMKPSVFEILSTPANCEELDSALLSQINPDAMTALHWDCFTSLKGELTAKQTEKVSKTLFEQVDSTTWSKFKHIDNITTDQLASLSNKITDQKKHAGTVFTDATINSLSVGQIGALNVGTVNALPESAWKGFNVERFKALRPEVLVKVTCNKLKQVPIESVYELTAAQAARLGEGINKPDESPRCVFTKEVLSKMKDPEAAKIMSGASQLVVSVILVVASMLLGLWIA